MQTCAVCRAWPQAASFHFTAGLQHACLCTVSTSEDVDCERHALQATRAFVNPYKVLQLSEDADSKQIKRAYRKLALR